jgi:ubiquinone/menaquinone biosynthesis C-methylase UbiE
MAALRSDALQQAEGEILEIGFGTGLNLKHYPERVRRITTVDPNPGMAKRALARVKESGIEVDQRLLSGEALPFADDAFDCVVSTWTLCSISDPAKAVGEICRVMKPGGRFIFLEHGLSDRPTVQGWQRRLNPIQRLVGDGCRLDVDIEAIVRGNPFAEVQLERFVMDRVPPTHGTMYRGIGVK